MGITNRFFNQLIGSISGMDPDYFRYRLIDFWYRLIDTEPVPIHMNNFDVVSCFFPYQLAIRRNFTSNKNLSISILELKFLQLAFIFFATQICQHMLHCLM